jgi:hypothetical protein
MGLLYPSFVDLGMDCGVGKYGCGGHHIFVHSSLASYQYYRASTLYIFFFPFVNIRTLLYIYIPPLYFVNIFRIYPLIYPFIIPISYTHSYTQHTYPHSNFDAHFYLFLFKGIGVHLLDISRGGRDCLIPFHCKGPKGVHLLDISRGGWDLFNTFSLQRAERGALIRYFLCLVVNIGNISNEIKNWILVCEGV